MIVKRENGTYASSLFSDLSVTAGFTTKEAGDMRDRSRILAILPSSLHNAYTHQCHSVDIVTHNSSVDTTEIRADGILTKESDTILSILTADCVSMLFATEEGWIGASHQGWVGSLANMAGKMIQELKDKGCSSQKMRVMIGPSIGLCCYTIPSDRARQFIDTYPTYEKEILSRERDVYRLNLLKLNYLQLRDAGIDGGHIDCFPFCTSCDQNRFYSFRRDGMIRGEIASYIYRHA